METVMSLVVGFMVAVSIYLMLSRHILRLLFGVILLSNAANLAIFTLGRLTLGRSPLVLPGAETLTEPYANPLPQALILTAIVIGFGLVSFTLVLALRAYRDLQTLDLEAMRMAEPAEPAGRMETP